VGKILGTSNRKVTVTKGVTVTFPAFIARDSLPLFFWFYNQKSMLIIKGGIASSATEPMAGSQ